MEFLLGRGYGIPTSAVPASAFTTACSATLVSPNDVAGRSGTDTSGRLCRARATVRSPVTDRRQADKFGTSTPKRVSKKRSTEVWSKVVEQRYPPRLKGEITRHGTRNPSPTGPAIPAASAGSGSPVRYSPGVPAGGVGGGTWSKKPPFSSYTMKKTVRAQTSGLDTRVSRISWARNSP